MTRKLTVAEKALYDQMIGHLAHVERGIERIGHVLDSFEVADLQEAFLDEDRQAHLIELLVPLEAAAVSLDATTLLAMVLSATVKGQIIPGEPTLSPGDADDLRRMFDGPTAKEDGDDGA